MIKFIVGLALLVAATTGCSTVRQYPSNPGVPNVIEPKEAGKYPGVIVLHPHSGLFPPEFEYADFLARNGYVAAVVDYYKPGGTDNIKVAYDLLIKNPKVDPKKIGIVGFSKGAKIGLEQSTWESRFGHRKYSAIVSYYIGPNLPTSYEHLPPVLFLHGELDVYVSKASIDGFCRSQKNNGRVCDAVIYPNVKHAFPRRYSNYNGYNAAAEKDAEARTLKFFNQYLKN
jgi:dienelactone hydrolase